MHGTVHLCVFADVVTDNRVVSIVASVVVAVFLLAVVLVLVVIAFLYIRYRRVCVRCVTYKALCVHVIVHAGCLCVRCLFSEKGCS